jgi:hypothetical protein
MSALGRTMIKIFHGSMIFLGPASINLPRGECPLCGDFQAQLRHGATSAKRSNADTANLRSDNLRQRAHSRAGAQIRRAMVMMTAEVCLGLSLPRRRASFRRRYSEGVQPSQPIFRSVSVGGNLSMSSPPIRGVTMRRLACSPGVSRSIRSQPEGPHAGTITRREPEIAAAISCDSSTGVPRSCSPKASDMRSPIGFGRDSGRPVMARY